jgi:hypothetical protein
MTIRKKIFSSIILVSAVLFAALSSSAQSKEAPYTLTLSAKTYQFRAGTDVKIIIVQTNTSKEAVECTYRGSGGVNHEYHYDVRDEDGNLVEKAVRPYMNVEPDDIHECGLEPGESSTNTIKLSRIYKLDRPGKYTVQVYRFFSGITDHEGNPLKVLSNTITITITG